MPAKKSKTPWIFNQEHVYENCLKYPQQEHLKRIWSTDGSQKMYQKEGLFSCTNYLNI